MVTHCEGFNNTAVQVAATGEAFGTKRAQAGLQAANKRLGGFMAVALDLDGSNSISTSSLAAWDANGDGRDPLGWRNADRYKYNSCLRKFHKETRPKWLDTSAGNEGHWRKFA